MSDILSKEEIDALLDAASSCEDMFGHACNDSRINSDTVIAPSQKYDGDSLRDCVITLRDFRRPHKLSIDNMRHIQAIHESYARKLSVLLTNILKTFVEIEVVSVDQLAFPELALSISNPSCIYTVALEPLQEPILFEVNPHLALQIVDRFFGGGMPFTHHHSRELTSVEYATISYILDKSLPLLPEAFHLDRLLVPKVIGYETNFLFVPQYRPSDPMCLITFEMQMLRTSGLFAIAYSANHLLELIGLLKYKDIDALPEPTQYAPDTMANTLREVPVELQAELHRISLSIDELAALKIGDTILLEGAANNNVRLLLNNTEILITGELGKDENHKTITVLRKDKIWKSANR